MSEPLSGVLTSPVAVAAARNDGVIEWSFIGRVPYRAAWELQRARRNAVISGAAREAVFFLEHFPPVITAGKHAGLADLRVATDALARRGIELIETDRGGKLTYHGPGQLVGYMIIDLRRRRLGVRRFVTIVENAIIEVLQRCGIAAGRRPDAPGVWIGADKIAALGFNIHRGVSCHGFALNVEPDLSVYDLFIPCGLSGYGVTSLAALGAGRFTMPELAASLVEALGAGLDADMLRSGA